MSRVASDELSIFLAFLPHALSPLNSVPSTCFEIHPPPGCQICLHILPFAYFEIGNHKAEIQLGFQYLPEAKVIAEAVARFLLLIQ